MLGQMIDAPSDRLVGEISNERFSDRMKHYHELHGTIKELQTELAKHTY